MEAIYLVRVMLFWDYEITRDAYGPYFTGVVMDNDEKMRYLWTIPPYLAKKGMHILVEFEQIHQHSIPITHDRNTTNMTEHITAVMQMVSDEPSMLYTTVNDDDDEVDESDGDDVVSSQSESDDTMTQKESYKLP
ncbi:hypothetical protein M9H77_31606 [Catharanthus roseus]|uniref:Uncharacterized protein n=1 Tax=Catharanthus roseus TaxID=4058 RepID=A0ACC0A2M7_CATRO|nr:hypothetical protein M9H77_31606 [Catharanthus roseus]